MVLMRFFACCMLHVDDLAGNKTKQTDDGEERLP